MDVPSQIMQTDDLNENHRKQMKLIYQQSSHQSRKVLNDAIRQIQEIRNALWKAKAPPQLVEEGNNMIKNLQQAKYKLETMLRPLPCERQEAPPQLDDSEQTFWDSEDEYEWDPEREFEALPNHEQTVKQTERDLEDPEKEFEALTNHEQTVKQTESDLEDPWDRREQYKDKKEEDFRNEWFSGRNVYCVPLRQGRM